MKKSPKQMIYIHCFYTERIINILLKGLKSNLDSDLQRKDLFACLSLGFDFRGAFTLEILFCLEGL